MEDRNCILETKNLSIGYRSKKSERLVQTELNLKIHRGELVCLIGPNGSGKSTLLRSLAGLQASLVGEILVDGKPIKDRDFKDTAKLLSIVLTEKLLINNLTAYEVVSIGRHPFTNWMGKLAASDHEIVLNSLKQVGLSEEKDRYVHEMSDGERQRVMIAKALAQDTPFIILDEPTAHLDLPNRVEIMKLLRYLAKHTSKAILLSTHELDLALQSSDSIWLMSKNAPIELGVPEDLILEEKFQKVFLNDSFNFDKTTGAFRMHYEQRGEVTLHGNSFIGFWTKRALEREGYKVFDKEAGRIHINILPEKKIWQLLSRDQSFDCYSIQELLQGIEEIRKK